MKELHEASGSDQGCREPIAFRFTTVPVSCGAKVAVPPVALYKVGSGRIEHVESVVYDPWASGAGELYFCIDPERESVEPFTAKALPKGFFGGDLLALDLRDVGALLRFQERYGMIYGARAVARHYSDVNNGLIPTPDSALFERTDYFTGMDKYEDFGKFISAIDRSREIVMSANEPGITSVQRKARLSAVSVAEVVAAVEYAQRAVKSTTRLLSKELGSPSQSDLAAAKRDIEYISRTLEKSFPNVDLVIGDQEETVVNLLCAVFAQLSRGLLGGDSFRTCCNPECGRVFSPREMGRRLDAEYCSTACQERAKRLRYINRHARI